MSKNKEQELQQELSSAYEQLKSTLTGIFNAAVIEAEQIAAKIPGMSAQHVLYAKGIRPQQAKVLVQSDESPEFVKLRNATIHQWMKISMSDSKFGELAQQHDLIQKLETAVLNGWERRAAIKAIQQITDAMTMDMGERDISDIERAKTMLTPVKTGPVLH